MITTRKNNNVGDMKEMNSGHDMDSMQTESKVMDQHKSPSKNLLFGVGVFSVVVIAVSIVIVIKHNS